MNRLSPLFPLHPHAASQRTVCALLLAAVMALVTSCTNIYEHEGDCAVTYMLRFRSDWNLLHADAFAYEARSLRLYVFDTQGHLVTTADADPSRLADADFAMRLDLAPGDYDLVAWCGLGDDTSFRPSGETETDMRLAILADNADTTHPSVTHDIQRQGPLLHGRLARVHITDEPGTHTLTMPLVRDTNTVRVVLQHLSGETVDKRQFTFDITDDNLLMNFANAVLPHHRATYSPWAVSQGTAGTDDTAEAPTRTAEAPARTAEALTRTQTTASALLAEFSVGRLIKGHDTRLTVRNAEGEAVISIPLIDYALLIKGHYDAAMDDQEYLDRQWEHNLTFFLDERDQWAAARIYINQWVVVLEDLDIH